MQVGSRTFRQVWAADFEFTAASGERPRPICLVAHELGSGRTIRLWEAELRERATAPYPTDPDVLFVAYYASAELACHLALGWPVPARVLDLFTEFRNLTNGRRTVLGNSLLGALTHFGLDAMEASEKAEMRSLALRGGPWTDTERAALLEYCAADVMALGRLFHAMLPTLDVERAVLRGRYMAAAARMEHTGVPIDTTALSILRTNWEQVKTQLITRIDADYGVYEDGTFKARSFAAWLAARNIAWPRLPSGALALDDDTFRQMARRHPELQALRELRVSLAQLRLQELAVGADGRNRCLLSAFGARTGRNAPSNSRFIFGPAVWLRGLIRPKPATALAYIDWAQQEFGIAAALSKDRAMLDAYTSGDPYLTFAKQAGAVPADATKGTHGPARELFKMCALGVQYGMGADALALRIGRDLAEAHHLLQLHRQTYPAFWRWSDAALDYAHLNSRLTTVFGWTIHLGREINPRSLRNFPMQANGAEMLRLACCLATERGIAVCAPVHDAILIEAPLDVIDDAVTTAQQAMSDASAVVLGAFRLRSEAKVIAYPDRYVDARGERMWQAVWQELAALDGQQHGHLRAPFCAPVQQEMGIGDHPSDLISLGLGLS